MATLMSDGSTRIIDYEGECPTGVLDQVGDVLFSFNAAKGIYEEQPDDVPLGFVNKRSAPQGYETVVTDAVFTSYNYDQETALADWSAKFVAENVQVLSYEIYSGDDFISLELNQ